MQIHHRQTENALITVNHFLRLMQAKGFPQWAVDDAFSFVVDLPHIFEVTAPPRLENGSVNKGLALMGTTGVEWHGRVAKQKQVVFV